MPTPTNKERLELLLVNGAVDVAQQMIERNKWPYIIVNGKLTVEQTSGDQWLEKFITVDPDTLRMKEESLKISKTPYEVLIYGETGTGKEIIAMSMIDGREGPIKSVNCAGFPRELIESELFGYVKGAFTGANKETEGLIQSASGGLMFLDEIGDLPLDMQAKLLRVLQDKKVRKIGATKEDDCTNVRFVFATNKPLKQMVSEGTFRLDLYARISTLEIDIKPLRDRLCDIEPILQNTFCGPDLLSYINSNEIAREKLTKYLDLNVRGLQQAVIRYAVLGRI